MARKKKSEVEQERPTYEEESGYSENGDGPTEMIDRSVELVDQTPVRGSVVSKPKDNPPEPPPKAERFRVMNGGRIMHRGFVTELKRDKIVTAQAYDLDNLRMQGIKLELITD